MRLTQFSNYAVRTLIYAGLKEHHTSGVPEISRAYGISQNHLQHQQPWLWRVRQWPSAELVTPAVSLVRV